jgi:hypothetical protein
MSRTQTKDRLTKELRLEQHRPRLDAVLLVVSTHSKHEDRIAKVDVARTRLTLTRGQWYFISVFSNHSFTSVEYGLIAHDTLEYINRDRPGDVASWTIPLEFCRPLSEVKSDINFGVYKDVLNILSAVGKKVLPWATLRDAFHVRVHLFKWLSCSDVFRAAHPLTEMQRQHLMNMNSPGTMDNVVYYQLAFALTRAQPLEATKAVWIRAEVHLLRHRLLLCPKLCQVFGRDANLTTVIGGLAAFHEANYERIRVRTDEYFASESVLSKEADIVHLELARLDRMAQEDATLAAKRMADSLRARPARDFRIDTSAPMDIGDLQACAAPCMRQPMAKAFGSTSQQARLSGVHRHRLTHFLYENKFEKGEIKLMQRPRIMIEYEMDEHATPWSRVEALIDSVEAERHKRSIEIADLPKALAEAEEKAAAPNATQADTDAIKKLKYKLNDAYPFQMCHEVMECGMCPFHSKPTAAQQAHLKSSFEARCSDKRKRYSDAKKRCHSEMVDAFDSRVDSGTSSGEKVKYAQSKSPYIYTQIVLKGEKANVWKQAVIVEKRRKTMSDNAAKADEKAEKIAQAKAEREAVAAEQERAKQLERKRLEANQRMEASRLKHKKLYATLGLTHTATRSEVTSAYKKLMLVFHPDKQGGNEASSKFHEIKRAYERLLR